MRISIVSSDPGYENLQAILDSGVDASIELNGLVVRNCITADEELGFVKYYVSDARGGIIKNEATGEAWTHVSWGVVEIIK